MSVSPTREEDELRGVTRRDEDPTDDSVDLAADDEDPDKIPDDVCYDEEGNFYLRGMDEAERAEFIACIKRGIADADAGRTIPADVFLAKLAAQSR